MHWAKRAKYNKNIEKAVWIAKHQAGIQGRPQHSGVKLRIELRTWRQKLMDRDNLVGACKPIIDALVTNGILMDDSPEHVIDLEVVEEKVPQAWAGAHIDIELPD
jgi:hypothetical protein